MHLHYKAYQFHSPLCSIKDEKKKRKQQNAKYRMCHCCIQNTHTHAARERVTGREQAERERDISWQRDGSSD